jgi:CDP-4-dehydro-6-deoxyglucose reductase
VPEAIVVKCTVVEKIWLTPTVMKIRFEPSKRFSYQPGQFLSLIIPPPPPYTRPKRRIYSFASPHDGNSPYELSVKYTGGPGTSYLASLKVGDVFRATAPYGDFLYEPKAEGSVAFISTGTGIAPFKAMVESKRFQENMPTRALMLFGARTDDEIIYPGYFESLGLEVVNAISRPSPGHAGFRGRVTDFLRGLPAEWPWHSTDFFICGNGEMITEVYGILRDAHGVPESQIHQEVYFATSPASIQPPIKVAA